MPTSYKVRHKEYTVLRGDTLDESKKLYRNLIMKICVTSGSIDSITFHSWFIEQKWPLCITKMTKSQSPHALVVDQPNRPQYGPLVDKSVMGVIKGELIDLYHITETSVIYYLYPALILSQTRSLVKLQTVS